MAGASGASVALEAQADQVAVARRFVRRELAGAVPERVSNDLQLIVSELFTNAVEHGHAERIAVTVELLPGSAEVTVESESGAPDVGPLSEWDVAERDAASGRGLGIVRRLADVVRVERDADHFVVTAGLLFASAD